MCRLYGQRSPNAAGAAEPLCSSHNALRFQAHAHPFAWGGIADPGSPRPSTLNLLVSDGRLLAASRRGKTLHWILEPGEAGRFVVASEPIGKATWREVPEGGFVGWTRRCGRRRVPSAGAAHRGRPPGDRRPWRGGGIVGAPDRHVARTVPLDGPPAVDDLVDALVREHAAVRLGEGGQIRPRPRPRP